ncbi:MAG: NINE protein [Olsenella sp.]
MVTQDPQGDTEEGGVQDVTTGDVISSVDEGVAREVESPTDRADSRGTSFFVPDDSKSIDKGTNESLGEGQEDEGPPPSKAVTQETRFSTTHEVAFSQSQEDDYQVQPNPQSQGPHPRGQDAQQGPYATYAQPQGQTYDQPGASATQAYPQQPTSYTQVQVFTQPPYPTRPVSRKSRVAAGLLAIFCGILGFHKFYLGYISAGIIMFLLTFFLWWTIVVPLAMFLVSIIEGVMYLTKSDEEFQRIYVQSQKDWF